MISSQSVSADIIRVDTITSTGGLELWTRDRQRWLRKMGAQLIELSSETFEQALTSRVPVAVDFYADWCVPCKAADSIIEKLSEEYRGRLTFARLNVDANHEITDAYEVMSIPALLIFSKGQVVKRFVGARKIKGCRREISRMLSLL
jgi:thioredoxin 1